MTISKIPIAVRAADLKNTFTFSFTLSLFLDIRSPLTLSLSICGKIIHSEAAMTYLRLKNDRLRISLTKYETEQIFGSAEGIDKSDPRARIAIKMLFKRAVSAGSFKPNCSSVWIEIAKNLSGGYDIYFIKGKAVYGGAETLVLEFKSCEEAIGAARLLKAAGRCAKSSFYRIFDGYRIITEAENGIYGLSGAIEFAESVLSSDTDVAQTREFGKEIIKEIAVNILAEL